MACLFGAPPGPDQWPADVERLERDVVQVVEELNLKYYLVTVRGCRILEYPRGNYRDGALCENVVPFDTNARADFEKMAAAVKRSRVVIDRIYRDFGGIYVLLQDNSWQYNWAYLYHRPEGAAAPAPRFPEETWTHIRGPWWFHRARDD
jgi:hypothetical protein